MMIVQRFLLIFTASSLPGGRKTVIETVMDTFHDRVEQIAEHYKMKTKTLVERCGVPYPTFRSSRYRLNDPQLKTIMRILDTCPRVRMEWLIAGKGEMLKPAGPTPEQENAEVAELKKQVERLTQIILEKEKRIIELELKLG